MDAVNIFIRFFGTETKKASGGGFSLKFDGQRVNILSNSNVIFCFEDHYPRLFFCLQKWPGSAYLYFKMNSESFSRFYLSSEKEYCCQKRPN